jgi:hypothetical protein
MASRNDHYIFLIVIDVQYGSFRGVPQTFKSHSVLFNYTVTRSRSSVSTRSGLLVLTLPLILPGAESSSIQIRVLDATFDNEARSAESTG